MPVSRGRNLAADTLLRLRTLPANSKTAGFGCVHGLITVFQGSDAGLKMLAAISLFSVRLGTLKSRGF